jgi:hypothetical protein
MKNLKKMWKSKKKGLNSLVARKTLKAIRLISNKNSRMVTKKLNLKRSLRKRKWATRKTMKRLKVIKRNKEKERRMRRARREKARKSTMMLTLTVLLSREKKTKSQ